MSLKAVPGGAGQDADAALVSAELGKLPKIIADSIAAAGIGVVACHDNVTDYATSLIHDHPRNWPPGVTWASVPGAYVPALRQVVIATIASAGGARHVPRYGELQSSRSLAIHETMHAYDYEDDHRKSQHAKFLAARQTDFTLLGSDYFTNVAAGAEETFAESAAMHFGSDQSAVSQWPHLAQYWADFAKAHPSLAMIAPRPARQPREHRPPHPAEHIGQASMQADGTLTLDLRADGSRGEVGHALLVYKPGHKDYDAIKRHVVPSESKHHAMALNREGAGGARSFLVKPFY